MPDGNFETALKVRRDRRKKADWVVRSVSILSVLGWLSAVVTLFFIGKAEPSGVNLYTKLLQAEVITAWDVGMLRLACVFLLFSIVTCAAGMIANVTRKRRKTDRYNKSVIILGVLSIVGFIVFLVNYAGVIV